MTRPCLCPDPACPIDHVAVKQRCDRMRDALVRCKELRRDAMQHEDTDPVANANTPDDAFAAINRATLLHIRTQVWAMQERQNQSDEDALLRLCVQHGISPDPPAEQHGAQGSAGGSFSSDCLENAA